MLNYFKINNLWRWTIVVVGVIALVGVVLPASTVFAQDPDPSQPGTDEVIPQRDVDIQAVVKNSLDTGWYTNSGFHNPSNTNYIAGRAGSFVRWRDWGVFDLSGITGGSVQAATLSAFNPRYLSCNPTETWTLFDVTTPIAALTNGTGGTAAYTDLGTGTSYGSVQVSSSDNGTWVNVNLNTAGINAINAAAGTQVAIGGALLTAESGPCSAAYIFGFSGRSRWTLDLTLNQPPVADPNGPYLGAAGSAIAFDGTGSSDPDGDKLTYDWDWGDTTSSSNAGKTPSHTYSGAGIYDVCLTVTDPGGLSDTACTFVVVYDPSAGFVTGGGWIDSPSGAYTPDDTSDPDFTGRANFGFVAKYKKGANVPDGQTEFQFKAGDLNFHSSSYEWLVVAGQDKAKFKGEGTINGGGNYGFMLTATDNGNSGDTFRIKIWDAADESVVYDNQSGADDNDYAGTVISGGNIKVHAN